MPFLQAHEALVMFMCFFFHFWTTIVAFLKNCHLDYCSQKQVEKTSYSIEEISAKLYFPLSIVEEKELREECSRCPSSCDHVGEN